MCGENDCFPKQQSSEKRGVALHFWKPLQVCGLIADGWILIFVFSVPPVQYVAWVEAFGISHTDMWLGEKKTEYFNSLT